MRFCKTKKCLHKKISPAKSGRYCPDCGDRVFIDWYIARCSCCNNKRKTFIIEDSKIVCENFCSNCGEKNYYLEKIENPNFFDLKYASAIKRTEKDKRLFCEYSQVWVEEKTSNQKRMLTCLPLLR